MQQERKTVAFQKLFRDGVIEFSANVWRNISRSSDSQEVDMILNFITLGERYFVHGIWIVLNIEAHMSLLKKQMNIEV